MLLYFFILHSFHCNKQNSVEMDFSNHGYLQLALSEKNVFSFSLAELTH